MTMITNPADIRVQAMLLRMHLKALEKGLKNSRLSGTQILAKASKVTGRAYKRGQYQVAIEDLNNIIKETAHA